MTAPCCVEQLLDPAALALAEAAFDWSVANPGPAASRPFEGIDGAFYQDLCNPAAPWDEHYQVVLHELAVRRAGDRALGRPRQSGSCTSRSS